MKIFSFFAVLLIFSTVTARAEAPKTPSDWTFYQKSGEHSAKWDDLVKSGFESYDGGHMATAMIFFRKAFDSGCRDPLVLTKLGLSVEAKNDFERAASYFIEAARRFPFVYPSHPDAVHINEHAGRALYQLGRFNEAVPYLESALQKDPENFMLLFMTAQILRSQKKVDEAMARFQKALTLPPPKGVNQPQLAIYRELTALAFETGDYDGCLKYADQLLTLNPNDSIALSFRDRAKQKLYEKREREVLEKITQ
ncbi:MAG: DUF3808 domain-containing protein [Deltaproteobacteria bacterium]|nr:DUF3808 domain-containing protein [Deltaproteobacteria bacterium]